MASRGTTSARTDTRPEPVETRAEVEECTAHYDPIHHTDEDFRPREDAATVRAATRPSPSLPSQGPAGVSEPLEGPNKEPSPLAPGLREGAKESETKTQVPGKPVEWSTRVLDAGRDLLQSFAPLNAVHEHVCGFHFYAHDMARQVEAHHYCSHPSEEFRQCVLYDSDQPGARLIGIEYIISDRLFKELPEEEKKFWHSHSCEIGSGILIAPGVPGIAERQDMQKLARTYGKTFHTWQVDRGDTIPLGPPQLMMAFTADGQMDGGLLAERDARYGSSAAEKREERASLDYLQELDPGADHWQQLGGEAWQTDMVRRSFKPVPGRD